MKIQVIVFDALTQRYLNLGKLGQKREKSVKVTFRLEGVERTKEGFPESQDAEQLSAAGLEKCRVYHEKNTGE